MKQPPSGGVHLLSANACASSALPLRGPVERLAQAVAVELDVAVLLVAELDDDLDGGAVAQERRDGEREHDAHLVVENVGAVAAQRLVDRFLAVGAFDDQTVRGVDENFLRQLDLVAVAIDDELGLEARSYLDVGAEVAIARAFELHLIDAGARLAIGGLPLPRADLLRGETLILGSQRTGDSRQAEANAGGKEKAERAAARLIEH